MYIPTFNEMLMASRAMGRNSNAPELWRGCVGCWPLAEGGGDTAFDLARGNHATHLGDPTYAVGELGRDLGFDGVDDYVMSSSQTPNANEFTVAFWLYNRNASYTGNRYIVSEYEYAVNKRQWSVLISENPHNELEWVVSSDGTSGALSFEPLGYNPPENTWVHVAVIANSSGLSAQSYINGTFAQQLTMSRTIANLGARFTIGGLNGASYGDARFANVLKINRALAPSEIQQLYERPHDMLTLRRPVTTVLMGESPATTGYSSYYNKQQQLLAG